MTVEARDIRTLAAQGQIKLPARILDQDGKKELAEVGTPLTITEVQVSDEGDYGPNWQIAALADGEEITFRLSQNEHRDEFIQQIAVLTADGPVSGLRLRSHPTKNGNAFISLEAI